ncbi:hypothetical protein COO60DRAFT_1626075 [Scenedesmus sp. NREL 46B-D3]|nr:hypothetical protein COO60DRAFT_1626075 [Scenedesmus sp. NREL 46B-D3]
MTLLLNFQGAGLGSSASQDKATKLLLLRIFAGFWTLGLLNNSAYVIMIAGANEIAASAVGLVYLFAIGPTIVVKLTAPYWFHLVGYTTRFWVAAALMSCSFIIVGCSKSMTQQQASLQAAWLVFWHPAKLAESESDLLGVGLVAVQGGLGEASALGLCSLYPNQLALTAWSSGTGFAGSTCTRIGCIRQGVIKLSNAAIQKYPTEPVFKSLKAVALQRTGKSDEAMQLVEQVLASAPPDDHVLNMLLLVLKPANRMAVLLPAYEAACSKAPGDEELLQGLFACHVRSFSFCDQQQVAMKLNKQHPSEQYQWLGHVVSCAMDIHADLGGPTLDSPAAAAQHAQQLMALYAAALPHYEGLDERERGPADELLWLAAAALVRAAALESKQQQTAPHAAASSGIGYMLQALLVQEAAAEGRPYCAPVRLGLTGLHGLLGNTRGAAQHFGALDVKHIQHDTLSGQHLLPLQLGMGAADAAEGLLRVSLALSEDHLKDAGETLMQAFRTGTHTKVLEFVCFKERLERSHSFVLARAEQQLIAISKAAAAGPDQAAAARRRQFQHCRCRYWAAVTGRLQLVNAAVFQLVAAVQEELLPENCSSGAAAADAAVDSGQHTASQQASCLTSGLQQLQQQACAGLQAAAAYKSTLLPGHALSLGVLLVRETCAWLLVCLEAWSKAIKHAHSKKKAKNQPAGGRNAATAQQPSQAVTNQAAEAVQELACVQSALISCLNGLVSCTSQLLVVPVSDVEASLLSEFDPSSNAALQALIGWEARLSPQRVLGDIVKAQRQVLQQIHDVAASLSQRASHISWAAVAAKPVDVPVKSAEGASVGSEQLSLRVAPNDTAKGLVHRYLVYVQQNARRGTASTLTRSEVRGGGKKPYKQKGTGNARRGSSTSPLFPGGGITFGPKPKDWSIKMNKKERRLALATALQSAAADVVVVDSIAGAVQDGKTKSLVSTLGKVGAAADKKTLLVLAAADEAVLRAGRNVAKLAINTADAIQVFDVLNADTIVMERGALEAVRAAYAPAAEAAQ